MKKVMIAGKFNPLHPGHVFFFEKAKKFGDYLVVVVAHDKTIRDQNIPLILDSNERKKLIENVESVDKVVIGDCEDRFKIVVSEKPDIIVLGYDQEMDEKWIEKNVKKNKLNTKVVRIKDKLDGYKSSIIRKKLLGKKE